MLAGWLPGTPGAILEVSREVGAPPEGDASGGAATPAGDGADGGDGAADGDGALGGGGEEDSGTLSIRSCIRPESREDSQAVINRPTASSHGATVQKDRKEKNPSIG